MAASSRLRRPDRSKALRCDRLGDRFCRPRRRLDDPSVEEVNGPTGNFPPPRIVRHKADRRPGLVQLGEHLDHHTGLVRIEIAGGLVGEQDLRPPNHRARLVTSVVPQPTRTLGTCATVLRTREPTK